MRELAAYFGEGLSELRAIAVEAAVRVGLAIDAPAREAAPAAEETSNEGEQSGGGVFRLRGGRRFRENTRGGRPAGAPRQRMPMRLRLRSLRSPSAARALAGAGSIGSARACGTARSPRTRREGGCTTSPVRRTSLCLNAFDAFAQVENMDAKTVKNQVARLGRHRERKTPSGKANTFRAELPDGRRVDGMVFPGDLIWDEDPPPLADGALGRRRR